MPNLIECKRYHGRYTEAFCRVYQDENPVACKGCEHYMGDGVLHWRQTLRFVDWNQLKQEYSMDGIADLFKKPTTKREFLKVTIKIRSEIKVQIEQIAAETEYAQDSVIDVMLAEGIARYAEMKADQKK